MNWLRLHRLIQKDVCLRIIILEPVKPHHLALLVKTWLYHLLLVKSISGYLYFGTMKAMSTTSILTGVLMCVATTHR